MPVKINIAISDECEKEMQALMKMTKRSRTKMIEEETSFYLQCIESGLYFDIKKQLQEKENGSR